MFQDFLVVITARELKTRPKREREGNFVYSAEKRYSI